MKYMYNNFICYSLIFLKNRYLFNFFWHFIDIGVNLCKKSLILILYTNIFIFYIYRENIVLPNIDIRNPKKWIYPGYLWIFSSTVKATPTVFWNNHLFGGKCGYGYYQCCFPFCGLKTTNVIASSHSQSLCCFSFTRCF